MCVCVYIYIYIYIYIYGCVWVSVCLWVAGRIISSIFEVAPEWLEDLPLSTLTQRPHKELCSQKPARPEDRTKDVGQSETPKQRDNSSPRHGAGQSALRHGSRAVGEQYGVKNEDTEQWRHWPD